MLALVDHPTDETATMPAPEDLNVQTPGEQPAIVQLQATNEPATEQQEPAANQADSAFPLGGPAYSAKHNGGGRWKIWYAPTEGTAGWFGDFVGDKTSAKAEAERLNAGGEPLEVAPAAPAATAPAKAAAPNAATLKQPVMTEHGWLCPEPAVKE